MTETTADNRGKHQVGRIVLIFKRIGYSPEPLLVTLRYCLVLTTAVVGIVNMRNWWRSFSVPYIFQKDIIQEFLISKAVLGGVDPYLPLSILADRYTVPLPNLFFQHPSPHPPPVALALPAVRMAILRTCRDCVVFLRADMPFRIGHLPVSVVGCGKEGGACITQCVADSGLDTCFFRVSCRAVECLVVCSPGGAWQRLRSGKDIQGGILLGSAIAVKLVPWPIIIFLLLRKNWRAAYSAITMAAAANIAASMLIGFDRMTYYYLKIGMSVSSIYYAHIDNFSLWTIGWRMFYGTGLPVSDGAIVPPLFTAPAIAPFISIAIPFVMLIFGLIFAFQARALDTSFGILICLMILVSPVAWNHYLITALIPLVVVVRNLYFFDWPRKETNIALSIGITFFFSAQVCMPLLTGNGIAGRLGPTVLFTVSLLSFLPAMGLLGLLWLLRRMDRFAP